MEQCKRDVLAVLHRGIRTIRALYRDLPQYKVGDCEIDRAVAELAKEKKIFNAGYKSEGAWGLCVEWSMNE